MLHLSERARDQMWGLYPLAPGSALECSYSFSRQKSLQTVLKMQFVPLSFHLEHSGCVCILHCSSSSLCTSKHLQVPFSNSTCSAQPAIKFLPVRSKPILWCSEIIGTEGKKRSEKVKAKERYWEVTSWRL